MVSGIEKIFSVTNTAVSGVEKILFMTKTMVGKAKIMVTATQKMLSVAFAMFFAREQMVLQSKRSCFLIFAASLQPFFCYDGATCDDFRDIPRPRFAER